MTTALALVVAWLAVPVLQERKLENEKDWPTAFSSVRYDIRSNATREHAKKLADHMDLVFDTYAKLFALKQMPAKRSVIVLFREQKEYAKHSETPGGSDAYYDPNNKYLVGYYDAHRMYNVYAHEGMHQFTDIALKGFDRCPQWFVEGMAECIGNSVVEKGKLFMCAKNGVIAQENLPIIQEMIRKKKHVPLKDLVVMSDKAFDAADGMYPESWSFCYFLLAYPNYEDKRSQIPNGKYWTVLSTYIRMMSQPKTTLDDCFRASFQLNGKPLDFDVLEKEWIDWVLAMKNVGSRGFDTLPVGTSTATADGPKGEAGPGVTLMYPAKTKGTDAEPDRSNAPYPLLVFAADEEGHPYKLCDWLARELASTGFMTAVVDTTGVDAATAASRLALARDWAVRRNAATDWKLKGMVDPNKVIVAGHGIGGHAALLAAADATKFAGAMAYAPSGLEKMPDKIKTPILLMSGEDEMDAAARLYAQLKKPRYFFAVGGADRAFTPNETAGIVYDVSMSWLCYKFCGRDDWKTYIVGDAAKKEKDKGVYKDWRVEE